MRLLTGTSGYAYKEWKGSFYPEELPAAQMLRYYAGQFPAVEINNTFYRMPATKMLEEWSAQVPAGFTFVLKASRQITHILRLKEVAQPVSYLLQQAAVLGDKLGPLLFQLPPNLKKDLPRLEAFLALLPAARRAALEFRHASWFEDDVFAALQARDVALCVSDTDEESATPFAVTADWGYLRLRREMYGEGDLGDWAKRVADAPWKDAFVFFKHEEAGAGPKLAKRFAELFRG
ncbi:MAG: DUF72 domain-containing protein [Gemmatimonadetes bacterium]|nr:DUF72 domain-containing protein [Gemmatimonadota bacterium]